MPRLLLVTYDLDDGAADDYAAVLSRIKAAGPYLQLSESAYAVLTATAPKALRDSVARATTTVDKLYVGALDSPAAWRGYGDKMNQWLKDNLP